MSGVISSFVKNVSEHRFTQGVVAIGGDRVSIVEMYHEQGKADR